jgi:hypothetical protein
MQILYKSSTRNFSIVFSVPVGILHRMTHQIEGDSFIKVANMPVRTPAPDPPGWSDPGPSSPHNSRDASPFFLKKETPCGPEGARRVERSAERTFRPLEKGRRKNMLKAFFPALPPDFIETGVELAKGRPPDLRGHLSICAAVRPAQKTPRRATLYHVAPRRAMPRCAMEGRAGAGSRRQAVPRPRQAKPRHATPRLPSRHGTGRGSPSADTPRRPRPASSSSRAEEVGGREGGETSPEGGGREERGPAGGRRRGGPAPPGPAPQAPPVRHQNL